VPDGFPIGTGEEHRTIVDSRRDPDDEVTVKHLDVPQALRELRALISCTESLASAAHSAYESLEHGPPSGYGRRAKRLDDLLGATRDVALRALELGDRLAIEVTAASTKRAG
jgi:hypothetical protein